MTLSLFCPQALGRVAQAYKHILPRVLTSTLDGLAYYPWPPDEAQRKDYMTASGIGKAVRFLLKAAHYGDNISGMATKLQARWQAGDFEPKPVSGDNNLISDESDSEDEARPANLQNTPTYGNGLVKHLMRGVSRYYNAKGTLTSKLDPSFRKQDADVFGHNGLTVGEYAHCPPFLLPWPPDADVFFLKKIAAVGGLFSFAVFGMVPMDPDKAELRAE